MLELRISASRLGRDSWAVALSGEIDAYTVDQVRLTLSSLLDEGARWVIVDLLGVGFIDSLGVAALASAASALAETGGQLVLATDDAHVLRTLELMGLTSMLEVERSLVEAVEHVVGSRIAG